MRKREEPSRKKEENLTREVSFVRIKEERKEKRFLNILFMSVRTFVPCLFLVNFALRWVQKGPGHEKVQATRFFLTISLCSRGCKMRERRERGRIEHDQ